MRRHFAHIHGQVREQATLTSMGLVLARERAAMAGETTRSPTDFLAAERTFLAWVRTGLALMGFGFVVARFGLFIQELGLVPAGAHLPPTGLSLPLGTALIALGVVVNVFCGWAYVRVTQQLKRGETVYQLSSSLGVLLAGLLAVLGVAMVVGLMSVSKQRPAATDKTEGNKVSTDNGIVSVPSHQSVDKTVDTLQSILREKGIKLFALVDHSGEAKAAGLQMRPTKLLIFGSPKAGTPLMLAAPTIAIDLPLKILVWEDTSGKAWISYNAPAYLQARHALPQDLLQPLSGVAALAGKAAE
jgi:uncharacterized protein (DUF302 family)/uncharacterized membrane protein YidH (DUF202 family)